MEQKSSSQTSAIRLEELACGCLIGGNELILTNLPRLNHGGTCGPQIGKVMGPLGAITVHIHYMSLCNLAIILQG